LLLKDLPEDIQDRLPDLKFAGHTFAQNPSQRMIIVNDKILKEGGKIDPFTRLVEITWEGVILESDGAIISEYAPDEPVFPSNFLARNRIVSGLCVATIVIEAPTRSGSLVTARLALEQNREVFAAPGPANHFNYAGSHQLIREGARLAVSAQDILNDLNIKPIATTKNFSPEEKLILKNLPKNKKPLPIDKIIELTKLDSRVVNKNIAFLIIKGIIKEALGRYGLQ